MPFCSSSVRSGGKRLPASSRPPNCLSLAFICSRSHCLTSSFPSFFTSVVLCVQYVQLLVISFCSHSLYVCMLSGKSLDNSSLKAQSSTSFQPDSSQGSSAALYCKSRMARQTQPATYIHTHIHMLCQQFTFNTFFFV